MSNFLPVNTTFLSPEGKAELFFQTVNLDHFLENYEDERTKAPAQRQHFIKFSEIVQRLKGDVLFEKVNSEKNKYYAIALLGTNYYYTVFYLSKRTDCDKLFAIIVTCYATNNKDIHQRFDDWYKGFKAQFRGKTGS